MDEISGGIIQEIKEKSGLSDAEIDTRIMQKQEQLHSLVSRDGAMHILATELGIQVTGKYNAYVPITKLVPGMRFFDVQGCVVRKYPPKRYEKNGKTGEIGSLLIGDGSHTVRVVFWNELAMQLVTIQEGDTISLHNPKMQQRPTGEIELHVLSTTKVTTKKPQYVRKPLSKVDGQDKGIIVYGSIVAVQDIRFFEQCPACRKRLHRSGEQWQCPFHGIQMPQYGSFLTFVLDDGTATIHTLLFSGQVDSILQCTPEEMNGLRFHREKAQAVIKGFLGQPVLVTGHVQKNEAFSRIELRASQIKFPKPEEALEHLEQLTE